MSWFSIFMSMGLLGTATAKRRWLLIIDILSGLFIDLHPVCVSARGSTIFFQLYIPKDKPT